MLNGISRGRLIKSSTPSRPSTSRSMRAGGLVKSKATPRTAPRKMKYGGRTFTGPSKGKLMRKGKPGPDPGDRGCNWSCPDGAGGFKYVSCNHDCPCSCEGVLPGTPAPWPDRA